MQLKPHPTAHTEPKNRPHPENMHENPGGEKGETDDTEDEDAESTVRPDDFDLPKEDPLEEDVDDEIDEIEEANRPG